ncbi:hypothetical protein EDB19DRAFT_1913464 [Suillus lakei]|nr:hypothetical protein EDB19DRAFT_1913464 [Suillus lakei]
MAFLRSVPLFDCAGPSVASIWWLQIWDWQHSTSSNSILSGPIVLDSDKSTDFCFLGNNRFLIVSDDLKLYSIEDMSQSPQLLACFLLPAQQVTWISDPKHRLLSLVSHSSNLDLIISTSIFFDDFFDSEGMTATIPWIYWGPLNVRIFLHQFPCRLGVSGNRALYAFPADGATQDNYLVYSEYRLHLMDFNPLAVRRHQAGLGRLVNEPSTVVNCESGGSVTTFLPYVEVVSDRTFSYGEFVEIWLDKDKIYLFKENIDTNKMEQLEVIEIPVRPLSNITTCIPKSFISRSSPPSLNKRLPCTPPPRSGGVTKLSRFLPAPHFLYMLHTSGQCPPSNTQYLQPTSTSLVGQHRLVPLLVYPGFRLHPPCVPA